MSFDIEGWIEVCRFEGAECNDEHSWSAVVDIGAIVGFADEVSTSLFGLSKGYVSGMNSVAAMAANRGLPPNPSGTVVSAIDRIRAHEVQYGSGEFGGYTFATWREVQEAEVDSGKLATSDWKFVFELAAALARHWELPDNQVRFVAWYNW